MKKTAGFTLIEILIVVVLFSLIGAVGSSLFSSTLRGSNKANILNEIKQNGSHALGIMERYIRNSKEIIILPADCDLAGTHQKQQLEIKNLDGTITTFSFDTSPGLLQQKTDTGSPTDLTNASVSIDTITDSPYFICSSDSAGLPSTIKIHFVMKQGGIGASAADQSASVTFDTTIAIRNK